MRKRAPVRPCGRCGKRFATWSQTSLCGACLSVPYDAPDTKPIHPAGCLGEVPGQLSLLEPPQETLPLRDGAQWLELPGETWEDIFFPPAGVAA